MDALPENLDFQLYFTLFFVLLVVLGMLFGFLRGARNSAYALGVKILFYVLFFITLIPMTNFLWTLEIPAAMGALADIVPEARGAKNLQEAVMLILESGIGEDMSGLLSHNAVIALIEGVALFALKIVYLVIYFSIFKIIYHLIFFIVRLFVFPRKKRKKKTWASRGIGAGIGAFSGLVSIFVFLIFFGGLMSINESLVSIFDEAGDVIAEEDAHSVSLVHDPDAPAQQAPLEPGDPEEALEFLRDVVEAYNNNPFVEIFSELRLTDEVTGRETELHLHLFDMIFSFDYYFEYEGEGEGGNDENPVIERRVSFRKELSIVAEVAGIALSSDYMESSDLADISGDDIRAAFRALSSSDLLSVAIPVAIEAGADFYEDVDLEDDVRREIYAIPWDEEIDQFGAIAALAFDIIHHAGLMDDETDYETVTIDGDDVRDLFDHLAESNLVTLSAFVAMELAIDMMDENMQAIITVPEGIEWDKEFRAFGAFIGAVVDTGVTVGELQDGDPNVILEAMADLDTTIALDSLLFSHALKNILAGEGDFEQLEMLVAHDDILWFDEWDDDDEILEKGELRRILLALNEMMRVASKIDFDDIGPDVIVHFDKEAFDALMASDILAHTIGNQLVDMAEEQDILTIPHTVKVNVKVDAEDVPIIIRDELTRIYDAFMLLDLEDVDFDEFDAEIEGIIISALATEEDPTVLDEEKADTLLASEILHATVSTLLLDMSAEADDFLVVPHYDSEAHPIRTTDDVDDIEYVSRDEFKNVLRGILSLDLTNFEDFENIGLDLITENISTLLDSAILHATVSKLMIDMSDVEEGEDQFLFVPHFTEDYDDDAPEDRATWVRFTVGPEPEPEEEDKRIEYIAKSELENVVGAIDVIGDFASFDDFEGLDDISLADIHVNIDTILDSAILQATVSNLLIDMTEADEGEDAFVTVPHFTEDYDEADPDDRDTWVRFTIGPEGKETEYIRKQQLKNVVAAIESLGFDNIDDFEGVSDISLSDIEENLSTILASAILHATVSNVMIDMSDVEEGEDRMVVVPHFAYDYDEGDPDDRDTWVRFTIGPVGKETEYIRSTEIESLLEAVVALDVFDSFDDFDFDTVTIAKIDDKIIEILDSAILHATISNLMIEMADDENGNDTGTPLIVPYVMDTDTHDQEDEDTWTYVRFMVGPEGEDTEYILREEIEQLVSVVKSLLGEEDTFDDFDFDTITIGDINENIDDIVDSAILHATISSFMVDMADDENGTGTPLIVPYVQDTGTHDQEDEDTWTYVRRTIGAEDKDTEYILKGEISNLMSVVESLIGAESTFDDFDFDTITISDINANIDDIVASAILQATISDILIDMGEDDPDTGDEAFIILPHYTEDYDMGNPDEKDTWVRYVIGDETENTDTEYIHKDQIKHLFAAIEALGFNDIDDFDGVDEITIADIHAEIDTLMASAIIQATVSDIIIDMSEDDPDTGVDAFISLPYYTEDYDDDPADRSVWVRFTIGPAGEETDYIASEELKNVVAALNVLIPPEQSINDFAGDVELENLDDDTNRETVLASAILQATISQQLIDLDADETIIVPHYRENYDSPDATTQVRLIVGEQAEDTDFEYIATHELDFIIRALVILEITSVDTFTGTVDLGLLYDDDEIIYQENRETVVGSAIIQATITDQLMDLDEQGTVSVPHYDEEENVIRLVTGETSDATFDNEDTSYTFIAKEEIDRILQALILIDITDVEAFDGTVSLLDLYDEDETIYQENRETIIGSVVIQATITEQLLDLDTAGTIRVPHYEEEDTTPIRFATGDTTDPAFDNTDTTFTYVSQEEIDRILQALILLGITDVEAFDGTVSLLDLYDEDETIYQENRETVVGSVVIQATITEQLLDLDTAGTIRVPHYEEEDTTPIRLVTGETSDAAFDNADTTFTYVAKDEIDNILQALILLGVTDVEAFTGTVSLAEIYDEDETTYAENRAIVVGSVVIQATITEQLFDLDPLTIRVPHYDEEENEIRLVTGDTNDAAFDNEDTTFTYVAKDEIDNILQALILLGVTDVEAFTGTVSLAEIYDEDETTYAENRAILTDSAVISATMSGQLFDLDPDTISIPHLREAGGNVRKETGEETDAAFENEDTRFEYVTAEELGRILVALHILDMTDIEAFGGSVTFSHLEDETDRGKVLDSAIIHATMSTQLFDLEDDDILSVPHFARDNATLIRVDTGDEGEGTDFEYVTYDELDRLIDALLMLGLDEIDDFVGEVNLAVLEDPDETTYQENRATVLDSSVLHATISTQLLDLDDAGTIVVPHYEAYETPPANHADVAVRKITGDPVENTDFEYVLFSEVDELIVVMNILNITDVRDFDGAIALDEIVAAGQVDDILESHIIHATIAQQVIDLGDDNIIQVPYYEEDTVTRVRLATGMDDDSLFFAANTEFEYLTQEEVKDMIYALDMLGVTDVQTYTGDIDLSVIYAEDENIGLLLASNVLHATLSDKMLNDTGGELVIPDEHYVSGDPIRIDVDDDEDVYHLTYVESGETKLILIALEDLGLDDLENLNFNPATIFDGADEDYDNLLDSVSIHATISKNILDASHSTRQAPALTERMIVTDEYREGILVEGAVEEQIEKDELRRLLTAFDELGVLTFDADITADIIQALTDEQLGTILESATAHITIDDMLRSNANILISEYAETELYAHVDDEGVVATSDEIILFINAVDVLGGANFATVSFDISDLQALDEEDREIVLGSMIVRGTLTPDLETAYLASEGVPIPVTYYENEDRDDALIPALTEEGVDHVVEEVYGGW